MPRELHLFLTRANRGEFQTLTSSEEVTGGLARLYGLSQRALLAAVALAFVWSSVALAERGHATAAGLCAAAAVVVFIMFIASIVRR